MDDRTFNNGSCDKSFALDFVTQPAGCSSSRTQSSSCSTSQKEKKKMVGEAMDSEEDGAGHIRSSAH